MNKWSRADYPKKKAWESPYGGPPPAKGGESRQYVNLENIPAKKFCLVNRKALEPEVDVKSYITAWMKENHIKGRWAGWCIDSEGYSRDVFTFKRTSDTVRFKLTWG
jgi:hypothetical protein